jgi:O-antigen ligase
VRRQAEIGLLVALCFFLPLYEAPKNLAWAAYLLMWLVNRTLARDFGGRWDGWDGLIAAWLGSGILVAVFAGLQGNEWRGALDLVRYGSVLWLLKRSRFSEREERWVLGALVTSTLVGLAMGYAALWRGTEPTLQLNSVGHVNHTAIYLAIMLGVSVAWLFIGRWPAVAAGVALAVLVSLFVTASRGAIGIALVTVAVLAIAWWRRSRLPALLASALVTASVIFVLAGDPEMLRKHEGKEGMQKLLAYRDGAWRVALEAWRHYPWFGVGMDNYSLVTRERVKAWRGEAGRDYDAADYMEFPHGHSLLLNTLAERGIVGTAPLAAVLIAWGIALVRRRPARGAPDDHWLLWAAAASAWLVTVGVGTVNTTLHHEHGLLAAVLLGLWLARFSQR